MMPYMNTPTTRVKSMQSLFQTLFIQYGVFTGFEALILAPLGLPIPEEVSLLAMGVLVGNDHASLLSAWIYGFLGVTLGDLIAWYFGRTVGWNLRICQQTHRTETD